MFLIIGLAELTIGDEQWVHEFQVLMTTMETGAATTTMSKSLHLHAAHQYMTITGAIKLHVSLQGIFF
jgi:hypothetical protein